jgi:hypothetical protein
MANIANKARSYLFLTVNSLRAIALLRKNCLTFH